VADDVADGALGGFEAIIQSWVMAFFIVKQAE